MKKFCVIGMSSVNRTWLNTEEEAIEHAKRLFRQNSKSAGELLVVEIKKTVRPMSSFEVVEPEKSDAFATPADGAA